jgi:polysaccharide biosynthesis transport protein
MASDPNASSTVVPDTEAIKKLRGELLDLSIRASDLEKLVGKDHLAAVKVRNQMENLRQAIAREQRRIAESFAKDYELAQARYNELSEASSQVTNLETGNTDAQARIRELSGNADTLRMVYNRMLESLSEMNKVDAQPSITADARVLMRAPPPSDRSLEEALADPGWRVVYGLAAGRFRCPGKEFPVRCVQNVAAGDPRDGAVLCCLAGDREC